MKKVLTLAIAAALATSGLVLVGHAQTKPAAATNRPAVEKAIAANETKINEAYAKGDTATMKSMIADDAVLMDMNGAMGVADMYKMMPTANVKITEQALSNLKFLWVDDTTVVLNYTWTGKGTAGGQPIPGKVFNSSVWTNRGGKWVAVFHQETVAAPPAPVKK